LANGLPYNLEILPGVRTDAKGRAYQMARYPSGKTVTVPYTETGAEPAQMIPVPKEPKRIFKAKLTTGLNGEKRTVKQGPNRLMVVRMRVPSVQKEVVTVTLPNNKGQEFVDSRCRNLLISPDQGKTWLPAFGNECDHFMQWHIDEEEAK
jgi:hypothetical protein